MCENQCEETALMFFYSTDMLEQRHLGFSKRILILIGIWPVEWTGFKLLLYKFYFYFQFSFFIISDVLCQGSMIFSSGNQFLETAANLGVTMVYIINIYRVIICRSSLMISMLQQIAEREEKILQYGDTATKRIYMDHVKSAFDTALFYVALGTSGVTLYIFSPLVKRFILKKPTDFQNSDYLIYPSWFPFDVNKNYFIVFILQINGAFLGYAYIVYLGAFFLCVLRYCNGQIKILQNFFRNFTYYSQKLAKDKNIQLNETAEIFTKFCIKEHQVIIRYVVAVRTPLKISQL